jgi:cold shock CspA family protein
VSALFDALKKMVEAKPVQVAPPSPGGPSLAELISGGALPVQMRPEARPGPLGGAGGVDVKKLAHDQLAASGRFADVPDDHRPKVTTPTGMFRKIADAGPRPRTPRGLKQVKPEKRDGVAKLSLALLKELGEDAAPLNGNSRVAAAFRAQGVQDSFELERILAIPRRSSDLNLYADLTARFRKSGGTMSLWPVQNAALHEMARANGLLAPIGVGHGKTAISLLAPIVMDAKRAVILVPPQLRAQLLTKDIPRYGAQFNLPLDRITIIAYSELSSARSADVLEQLKPDLIIADECHNLRHKTAARTKRFLRFMKEHPECRFVGLSGTITRRSLKDFQHLSELALKKNSPVPNGYHTLNEWSEAIDVPTGRLDPMPPGSLRKLCNDEEIEVIDGSSDPFEVQQAVRSAFRRRMVETPGVVATEESAIGTSLVLSGLRTLIPAEVQIALKDLRYKWEIAGEELVDILSVTRVGCQLAAGFYYKWVWPDGIPDKEWLEARAAWNKEVREILKFNRPGLDSPMLVANAAARGDLTSAAWGAWCAVKDRPVPPTEAVWISDYLVNASIKWGQDTCDKKNGGIVWYLWSAVGEEIARRGGFSIFGAGDKAAQGLTDAEPSKMPVIVCSQRAHGTGKNLQSYCRNLFTTPVGGVEFEQTLARTHRPGQMADEVTADIFVHTEEMERMWLNALRDARYIQTSQGQRQKLLYAEKVNLPEEGS